MTRAWWIRPLAASAAATVGVGAFGASPAVAHGFDNDGDWGDEHQISSGSVGDNVAFWELMLGSMDPCNAVINGTFGSGVDTARTQWFQGLHGLTTDGVVGHDTWTSAKTHISHISSSGGVTYYRFGISQGHGHGSGSWDAVAATTTWKRQGYDGNWYGTDHPTVHSPGPYVCPD